MRIGKIAFIVAGCLAVIFAAGRYKNWWQSDDPPVDIDARKELQKIAAKYNTSMPLMQVHGRIKVFDMENKGKEEEQGTFIYWQEGNKFYYRLKSLQQFCDGNLMIQLDTVNRYMTVTLADTSINTSASEMLPFDAFISDTATFRLQYSAQEINSSQRILTLSGETEPAIQSCALYYTPETYTLQKAELVWWKNPLEKENIEKSWKTVIEYDNSKLFFDVRQMVANSISHSNGVITPAARYRDYDVQINVN